MSFKKRLGFALLLAVICSGCGGSGSDDAPVSALFMPKETAKDIQVYIDTDINPQNGYVAEHTINCDCGLVVPYDPFNQVPADTYYAYAITRVVSPHDQVPEKGDYVGYYATGALPPSTPNLVVPNSGTAMFDILLSDYDPFQDLAGKWGGTGETVDDVVKTMSFTLDETGNLTGEIDGISINSTDVLSREPAQMTIFSFSNLGGTKTARLLSDTGFSHAAFLDEDLNFGMLQYGADGPPTDGYEATDIIGSWSGYRVLLDGNLELSAGPSVSSVTVADDFSFSGNSDGQDFNGTLSLADADNGIYEGTYSTSGVARAYVSPDKSFMATWLCEDNGGSFPEDYVFEVWSKR